MRRFISMVSLSVLSLVLAACPDARQATSVSERDSAGVSIASLPPLKDWPGRAVLATEPLVTFGANAPAGMPELSGEFWIPVARLSDHSFAVGDKFRFFLFRADGTLIDVIGRKGDGPGEFRDLRSICAGRGDTLLLVDDGRRIATIYDIVHRVVVRQFPTVREVYPGACSASLAVLVTGLPVAGAPEDHPAAQYELRSSVGDTVAEYPDLPTVRYAKYWYEPSFQFRADSLFVTDGQRMEVRVYAPGGALSRIVRIRERLDNAESGIVPAAGAPARGSRASAPKPSDGRYWFLIQVHGVTQGRWAAVSADGHPLGILTLPEHSGEFRVLQFRSDTVLVSQEREDGQRELAEYRIRWRGLPPD